MPPTVSAEAFAEIQRQSELAFAQLTAEWEARTAAERAAARRGGSGTAGSTGMTDAETLAAPTADAALSPALAPRQPWTGTTQSSPVLAPHPAQPRACALSISFTVHDRFC